ncbi:MAG TPA: TlpA disulfide reductase family protein [Cerasibacillus sp.]|uniref:TlpA family protein disulfide reductase n=1 Tax=Cerasibacillus sp. TaxID=2498711 RepID=UPI002F3FB766
MNKRIIGVVLLLVLGGIFVYNAFIKNDDSTSSNDQNTEGGVIMPKEAAGIAVGEKAPDFELSNLDDDKIRLSDLKGKKIILNFWASWCPPCKKEMPEMQAFYEEHHEDIVILAVNTAEKNPDNAKKFVEENGFTFPILVDDESKIGGDMYKALALPTTYFIGTDGKIQLERKIGPMTFDDMVEIMNKLK